MDYLTVFLYVKCTCGKALVREGLLMHNEFAKCLQQSFQTAQSLRSSSPDGDFTDEHSCIMVCDEDCKL